MRINENIALATSKVTLVPYSAHHVPTYHAWMQDPELQAATASEPLSMPEEYDMQRSWRLDHDKLTFIICSPIDAIVESHPEVPSKVEAGVVDSPANMIGDINLFLFEPQDDGQDEQLIPDTEDRSHGLIGEIELMVARKDLQRQGYGRASLVTLLSYILSSWDRIAIEHSKGADLAPKLDYLRVKISQSNTRSIALFTSINFLPTKEGANYFNEIELRWTPDQRELSLAKGWEEVKALQYIDSSLQGRP